VPSGSTPAARHPATRDGGTPLAHVALQANFRCTPVALQNLLYRNEDFINDFRSRTADLRGPLPWRDR
jgi:hypothetical protein